MNDVFSHSFSPISYRTYAAATIDNDIHNDNAGDNSNNADGNDSDNDNDNDNFNSLESIGTTPTHWNRLGQA